MTAPKVSVIIPCFNHGAFLEEAINSVLKSSFDSYEIIVVNDGSTDPRTKKVLAGLDKPRTSLLHSSNQGVSVARNLGIERSRGQYILPLDADDMVSSEYIGKAVEILDARASVGIVYCKAQLFGTEKGLWRLPDFSYEQMLASNIIFCSALYRKQDWKRVNGYRKELTLGKEDWDFWLSLLELGVEVYRIPEVHFYYRRKAVSRDVISNETAKRKMINDSIYNLHKELYDRYLESPLNLYQENMRLKHQLSRFDYRLTKKLFAPVYFFKRILKIP